MQKLQEFEKSLRYTFKNKELLKEALTHKSYKSPVNNERLEFLGDAVLDLIVGEYLYKKLPKANEGELSKLRASLVNEEGFAKLANRLNIGDYIFISQAEENNHGRSKPSLLSNAFEAVMGAIYLEVGLEKVREIVLDLLEKEYPKIDLGTLFKDFKTALQEFTQARFGVTPQYKLLGATGPDHKKEFEVAVMLHDEEIATAKGRSKKSAQQEAAKIALQKLKAEDE
ncbi:ribonuclease III [Nitratiruptor sp. YY09-18]|uniref:ribonuclease III n=1 Tax=Nitratiruptor sp. YY09-18 TaxID=2724901 RepID=UPI001914E00A|nr:ribonuclease III [Nitratiruptor sp. YY09-18]BCD67350.1 ribonuclease III [Nitratiruptor sp. YY09-18]